MKNQYKKHEKQWKNMENINKKKPFLVGVDIKWNEPKKSNIIIKDFFNRNVNIVKKNILTKISKKLF